MNGAGVSRGGAGFPVVLGVALALLTAAGCGLVPGHLVTQTPRPVTFEGRLLSGKANGYDCLWIVDSSGRRVVPLFISNLDGDKVPGQVVDASGRVVARAGDTVIVRGSEGNGDS